MDEVIKFLQRYAQVEKEAYIASFQEPDPAKFEAKLDRAQAFYWDAPGGTLLLSLGQPSDAGDMKLYGDAHEDEGRRVFMVKRFNHSRLGELYAAYTSPARPVFVVSYGGILYVARKNGALKIVSVYMRGRAGPKRRWEHMGGETIGKLGKPLEVRKLEAPERPDDKADYDAT